MAATRPFIRWSDGTTTTTPTYCVPNSYTTIVHPAPAKAEPKLPSLDEQLKSAKELVRLAKENLKRVKAAVKAAEVAKDLSCHSENCGTATYPTIEFGSKGFGVIK